MEIELKLPGFASGMAEVKKLGETLKAAGGGGGGAASGGPMARALKAQEALARAMETGAGVFDAQVRLMRANAAVQKARDMLNPAPAVAPAVTAAVPEVTAAVAEVAQVAEKTQRLRRFAAGRVPGFMGRAGPFERVRQMQFRLAAARQAGVGIEDAEGLLAMAQRRAFTARARMAIPEELREAFQAVGGMNVGGIVGKLTGGASGGGIFGSLSLNQIPKLMAAFEALSPVVAAAAVAFVGLAVGVAAFMAVVREGTERLKQFSAAVSASGGSPAAVARAVAAGIAPGQVAATASAFHARIASGDPFARAQAAAFGIHGIPGPLGHGSEVSELNQAIAALRKIKDPTQQYIAAKNLELEGLLNIINVSKDVQDAQDSTAARMQRIFTPEALQRTRDFEGAMANLNNAWGNFTAMVADRVLPLLTRLTLGLTVMIDNLTDKLAPKNPWAWLNPFRLFQHSNNTALNANTQAVNRNTQMWGQMNVGPGMHGGGPRAQGTLGQGWHGYFFSRSVYGHAVGMGAFH